jgi:hypothetical protein
MEENETRRELDDAVAGLQALGRGQRKDQLRAVRRALGLSEAALARERGVQVREIFRVEGRTAGAAGAARATLG